MKFPASSELDLMPPPFAEGLDDWSCADGTPNGPTYDTQDNARLVRDDADFGACLELRTAAAVTRLRYMGEMPLLTGGYVEVAARLKAVRGPLPLARIAAWAGGAQGRAIAGLPLHGPLEEIGRHGSVIDFSAVIGREVRLGVDLVWDARVLYAHVGIDLVGLAGAVVRIERVAVRDVTRRFTPLGRVLPGFGSAPEA